MNTAIGAIHATLSNPPRIGAASTIAPYFAANQFKIEVSVPPPLPPTSPPLTCCPQLPNHPVRIRTPYMITLEQYLPATTGAHQLMPNLVKPRVRITRPQHHHRQHTNHKSLQRSLKHDPPPLLPAPSPQPWPPPALSPGSAPAPAAFPPPRSTPQSKSSSSADSETP